MDIHTLCEFIRSHGNAAQPTPDGEEIVATVVLSYRGGLTETIIERINPTVRDVRNWLGY
jgi:hypothetical protein